MHQGYLDICGVPTKVVTWGRWVEESSTSSNPEDIVVCIPGNPGLTEVYTSFLQTIHEQLGYSVWIVGHAGHEIPFKGDMYRRAPSLRDNEILYGLHGQITHKHTFFDNYVPKNARIHFIGHSIGAYIILQLLKMPSIRSQTVSNYLLFPTIEKMADTPNGMIMTKLVRHIVRVIIFLSWIFTLLPSVFQYLLINILLLFCSIDRAHVKMVVDFFNPGSLSKVFCMAFDEMDMVKERDNDVLIENKSKIKMYYGANDRWAPQSYCVKLKKDIPSIDAHICTKNYDHAFVLWHSKPMANMVINWIRNLSCVESK